jgi:hypothetical protein
MELELEQQEQQAPDPVLTELAALRKEVNSLRGQRQVVVTPQESQRRMSHAEAEERRLIEEENVDPTALKQVKRLALAALRDQKEAEAQQNSANFAKQLENQYWKEAKRSAETLMEKIPSLADKGPRFVEMITKEISDEIQINSDFKSVIQDIQAGRDPDTKTISKVAAKVLDRHIEGDKPQPKAAAIQSSAKTGTSRATAQVADPSTLGPEARRLYYQNLKVKKGNRKGDNTPEEKQKAFALALKLEKEIR